MGYFNPFSYFVKSFIRIFTKKFFWVILICVCLFLGFIIFNTNFVSAATINSYDGTYGKYSGLSSSQVESLNSLIEEYADDYDSFFIRVNGYPSPTSFSIWFYNYSVIGELYVSEYISNNPSIMIALGNSNSTNLSKKLVIVNYNTYQVESVSNETEGFSGYFVRTHGGNVPWIYSNRNIYTSSSLTDIYFESYNTSLQDLFSTSPYIVNSNEVDNWSFDTLNISLGSIVYDDTNSYYLSYTLSGNDYGFEIRDYYNSTLGYFVIPRNQLTNNVVLRDNNSLSFTLIYRSSTVATSYDLGNYTLDLTSEEQEDINADSDKFVQGEILDEQKKTNDKLDSIDNTITDSSIDNITSDTLPSDTTVDITSEGVNGIFTSIYNAFCTGQAQDIIFPIPFTNKNITLNPQYVSNMLTSSGATWIITIIQAFWWYIISRFIIKDIMNKINKIKSGNIEQIETTNIRGDML